MSINRRNFILCVGTVLTTVALSSPIDSLIGEKGITFTDDYNGWDDSTAKLYVQDGLSHLWDGIENTDWGVHNSSTLVWQDLVGALDITLPQSAQANSDNILLTAENAASTRNLTIDTSKDYTVEVLFVYGESDETAGYGQWRIGRLAGVSFANQYFKFDRYWSGTRIFNTPATFNQYIYPPQHQRMVLATYQIRQSEGLFNIYYNGQIAYRDVAVGTTKSAARIELMPNNRHQYTYRMAVYSRALTNEEIAYNYLIDLERFGVAQ